MNIFLAIALLICISRGYTLDVSKGSLTGASMTFPSLVNPPLFTTLNFALTHLQTIILTLPATLLKIVRFQCNKRFILLLFIISTFSAVTAYPTALPTSSPTAYPLIAAFDRHIDPYCYADEYVNNYGVKNNLTDCYSAMMDDMNSGAINYAVFMGDVDDVCHGCLLKTGSGTKRLSGVEWGKRVDGVQSFITREVPGWEPREGINAPSTVPSDEYDVCIESNVYVELSGSYQYLSYNESINSAVYQCTDCGLDNNGVFLYGMRYGYDANNSWNLWIIGPEQHGESGWSFCQIGFMASDYILDTDDCYRWDTYIDEGLVEDNITTQQCPKYTNDETTILFGFKTADYPSGSLGNTTMSLYWNYAKYQCNVVQPDIDTIYLCNTSDISTSTCYDSLNEIEYGLQIDNDHWDRVEFDEIIIKHIYNDSLAKEIRIDYFCSNISRKQVRPQMESNDHCLSALYGGYDIFGIDDATLSAFELFLFDESLLFNYSNQLESGLESYPIPQTSGSLCAEEPAQTTADILETPSYISMNEIMDDIIIAYHEDHGTMIDEHHTSSSIVHTPSPTEVVPAIVNVSFNGAPVSPNSFMPDPYGRFEASIRITIEDKEDIFGLIELCKSCFIWQYRLDFEDRWTDIDDNSDDISFSITKATGNIYIIRLIIQSIRRLNAGHCYDENDNDRIFTPGNGYNLRLQFVADNGRYRVSSISDFVSIKTNTLPSEGMCIVENIDNISPLEEYNLFCAGWDNQSDLEFNALINNVLMNSNDFVNDARLLQSIAPVGNVSITVLVKERGYLNAITCLNIIPQFITIQQIIDNNSIDTILQTVEQITNETSFSDNPDAAISIHTVIQDIYEANLTTQNRASQLIDDMVENIFDSSNILDILENNIDNISRVILGGRDIVTELATISSLTSNEAIVNVNTTTVLADWYLPNMFDAIDIFIKSDDENRTNNIQDQLYIISQQKQQLIMNLESILAKSDDMMEFASTANNLTESLVDYALLSASKALSKSDIGETFKFDITEHNDDGTIKNQKIVYANKFESNNNMFTNTNNNKTDIPLPKCGNNEQNIELPLTFIHENVGAFDCTFMSSTQNNFVPKNGKRANREQQSELVSINIYGNTSSTPIQHESNKCFPYLITLKLNNSTRYDLDLSLDNAYTFPSCDFWNINDAFWDTEGCFVHDIINETVICACTHLTTFSLSTDKIIPEANTITELHWKQLTLKNLILFPTVWITILSIFVIFVIICYINPRSSRVSTKSIMAYEDIIYRSALQEKLGKDIVGKEIKCISDHMPKEATVGYGIKELAAKRQAKKSLCSLQFALWKVYLRNDHTLLSVFQRTSGTNYSVKQRLACFFMYLCTVMVATAMYYGIQQSTYTKDILASFVISLCGTLPTKVISKLFQKSKPLIEKTQRTDSSISEIDRSGVIAANGCNKNNEETMQQTQELCVRDITKKATTIGEFSTAIRKYTKNKPEEKEKVINDIRESLLDSMYPLPNNCKRIAWILLMIWTLTACIIAIVYGLSFDLKYTEHIDLYNEPCWNNSMVLSMERTLMEREIVSKQLELDAENKSSYGGSDTRSWLLSLAQSLMTSLLLWQPLTIYIMTWLKIWLFSWHLKLSIGPGNIMSLCKRCCCGYVANENENEDLNRVSLFKLLSTIVQKHVYTETMKESADNSDEKANITRTSSVIAHKNRPLDFISFLAHDEFVIEDRVELEEDNEGNTSKSDIAIELTEIVN